MAQPVSAVLLGLLFTCLLVDAFYLPGLAPTNFCEEEIRKALSEKEQKKCKVSWLRLKLEYGSLVWSIFPQSNVYVHVNKLDSVETIIPYEYSR